MSDPCVIHGPGQPKFWKYIEDRFFAKSYQQLENSSDLTIFTWNNQDKGCFERSMDLQGVEYTCLGTKINKWNNYYKFDLTLEALQSVQTPLVMACDALDVLLLQSPTEIVRRFSEMNLDMIFNCEKLFYPNIDHPVINSWKEFEDSVASDAEIRYLNSGMWIGKVEFLKEFFKVVKQVRPYKLFDCKDFYWLREDSIGCDQSCIKHVRRQFHPNLDVDYQCRIFKVVGKMRHFTMWPLY